MEQTGQDELAHQLVASLREGTKSMTARKPQAHQRTKATWMIIATSGKRLRLFREQRFSGVALYSMTLLLRWKRRLKSRTGQSAGSR